MKNVITLIALLLTSHAMSATNGMILLRGNVPQILSVQINAESIANTLPLDTTQVNTKIASINERSNSNTGYKVAISSANQGKLVRTGGTEVLNYTLKYDGNNVTLLSTHEFSSPAVNAVNQNKDLTVSFTGVNSENMVAGEYTDMLTFTISAN
jgi:hypothetical protein